MNDEDVLSLFALDLPDLFGCAPDLAQAVDVCVGNSFNAAALTLARPVAGGSPGWWDDIWDFLGGIWGGAGDLAEKIGRSFSALWDKIWDWIGGAIRWLYNWGVGIVDWLARQLYAYFTWVGNFINTTAAWIRSRVWDAAYYVRDRAWDVGRWVSDRAWDAAYYVRDRIVEHTTGLWNNAWNAANWIKDRVWDAALWTGARIEDAAAATGRTIQAGLEWAGGQIWDAAKWTKDRIWEAAEWTSNSILPPIMGGMGALGDSIGDAFGDVGDAIAGGLAYLGEEVSNAIKWPFEHIFEPYAEIVERKLAIPGKLLRGEYDSLPELVEDALDPAPVILAGIAGLFILVMAVSAAFQTVWQTFVTPMALPYEQATMARVGAQLLTIGALQEALNRGFIDESTAEDHLSRAGYSGQAKTALLELRHILPSPTDLINMAVREVFNPQARAELDLDAEFPEEFGQYAALLGIEREWAENHWARHWQLPSASMGYEMLHRRIIDAPALAALLKALDFAPVWRDKLQAISYNPITRVDLRRLYKTKVITEDQVFDGYRDIGYDDVNARRLTDFTIKHYAPEDESELDKFTEASASQIRLAYRRHLITRDEAIDKLMELDYTEDTADFLLALDDVQLALNPTTDADVPVRDLTVSIIRAAYREKHWTRERAQEELEVLGYLPWAADLVLQLEDVSEQRELTGLAETVIKEEYRARVIDRTVASMRLDELGVLPERRDLLLARWDLLSAQKTRALTVGQVQRGLREGVFTETEALSRFSGMGYNEEDSKFLVDDVDKTPEGKARRLSVSQLSRAYKVGAIGDAQLLEGLLGLDYSQEDAQVLIDIATPQPEDKERQLSGAQLCAGFRAGLVAAEELVERLIARGYAQADAELLRDLSARQMETPARRLSVSQLQKAYKADIIDRQGLLAELLKLGYTDRDAGWLQAIIAPEEEEEHET